MCLDCSEMWVVSHPGYLHLRVWCLLLEWCACGACSGSVLGWDSVEGSNLWRNEEATRWKLVSELVQDEETLYQLGRAWYACPKIRYVRGDRSTCLMSTSTELPLLLTLESRLQASRFPLSSSAEVCASAVSS